MNYTKDELAELCMTLEHNFNAISERFDNQYNYCLKLVGDMSLVNRTYLEAKEIVNQSAIKPKTNFEKITESVESLASYLAKIMKCKTCPYYDKYCTTKIPNCNEALEIWLQQECENG